MHEITRVRMHYVLDRNDENAHTTIIIAVVWWWCMRSPGWESLDRGIDLCTCMFISIVQNTAGSIHLSISMSTRTLGTRIRYCLQYAFDHGFADISIVSVAGLDCMWLSILLFIWDKAFYPRKVGRLWNCKKWKPDDAGRSSQLRCQCLAKKWRF